MTTTYQEFLDRKAQLTNEGGFEPHNLPDHLFDFQRVTVEWAVRQGRGAIFADCGMGKTPMELAWAEQVYQQTGKPVLMLTPLAVGFQAVHESVKFGHDAALSRNGKVAAPITITNYEQLGKFDSDDFGGVLCSKADFDPLLTDLRRDRRRHGLLTGGRDHTTIINSVQRYYARKGNP